MTVYLVNFLPNIPCIHRIYMVLANPINMIISQMREAATRDTDILKGHRHQTKGHRHPQGLAVRPTHTHTCTHTHTLHTRHARTHAGHAATAAAAAAAPPPQCPPLPSPPLSCRQPPPPPKHAPCPLEIECGCGTVANQYQLP